MKKVKLLSSLGFLALPLATVISCSTKEINPEGVLTVAVWKGNDVEMAAKEKSFTEFTEKTGIPIEVVIYGDNRVQDLSLWAASGDMPDVLLLDSGDIPSLATVGTILPIDGTKFEDLGTKVTNHEQILNKAKNFEGLVNNVFAPLVGKVENNNYTSGLSNPGTALNIATNVDVVPSAGVQTGASVYALPKDFSTLAAYVNVNVEDFASEAEATKNQDFINNDANFASIDAFLNAIDEGLSKPKANGQKAEVAKLGVTIDLSRRISLLDQTNLPDEDVTFYQKYKNYTGQQIVDKKDTFKADLKKALKTDEPTSEFNQFLNLRKDKVAASPEEHKYTWNGEAFDSKAVSAVIEGNWFAPKDKAKTEIRAIKDYSGLYYSAWALSAGNNDLASSYAFLQYISFGPGAIEGTEDVGLMPPNTDALKSLYDTFAEKVDDEDVDTAFNAKRFLAHTESINNAVPNLLTSVYPNLLDAWGTEIKNATNSEAAWNDFDINNLIDDIVAKFVTKIEETL